MAYTSSLFIYIHVHLFHRELKNLILDRVNLRLTLEWYKEWFSLLTDPLHTRRRGERETLWPIISDHLPEEDRKELKAKQRTAEKEWERYVAVHIIQTECKRSSKTGEGPIPEMCIWPILFILSHFKKKGIHLQVSLSV